MHLGVVSELQVRAYVVHHSSTIQATFDVILLHVFSIDSRFGSFGYDRGRSQTRETEEASPYEL